MTKVHFTLKEQEKIKQAIQKAEKRTSGEIQVHIEKRSRKSPLDRASDVFAILKMHRTALRNGVLIYLATQDKKFAILGDIGINQKVEDEFWDNVKEHMQHMFREGRFTDGLCEGIEMAGEQLRKYFPARENDRNELPDDISFGND